MTENNQKRCRLQLKFSNLSRCAKQFASSSRPAKLFWQMLTKNFKDVNGHDHVNQSSNGINFAVLIPKKPNKSKNMQIGRYHLEKNLGKSLKKNLNNFQAFLFKTLHFFESLKNFCVWKCRNLHQIFLDRCCRKIAFFPPVTNYMFECTLWMPWLDNGHPILLEMDIFLACIKLVLIWALLYMFYYKSRWTEQVRAKDLKLVTLQ